jgi:hypothetical protein
MPCNLVCLTPYHIIHPDDVFPSLGLDGKYYCRIYQHGIPGAITSTDDYDSEEEALEAAEEIIRGLQLKTDEA